MPLGTGNDLSRALGWGAGYVGSMGHKRWLRKVALATPVTLDRWCATISAAAEKLPPTFAPLPPTAGTAGLSGVFCNYLGVGIEAAGIHAFHTAREANPKAFNGRFKNQAKMGMLGVRNSGLCVPCCGAAPQLAPRLRVRVRRAGAAEWEDLPLPRRLKALILVNLPSHAAGRNLWGKRRPPPQSISDQAIEVVGFANAIGFGMYLGHMRSAIRCPPHAHRPRAAAHSASARRPAGPPYPPLPSLTAALANAPPPVGRLAQAAELTVEFLEPLHVQMDGEPWLQPPCTLTVSHAVQTTVLRAPSSKQQRQAAAEAKAAYPPVPTA